MNSYQKILTAFQNAGYYEDSHLSQNEMTRVLDTLATQNGRLSQFDRNVSAELWEQTPKQSDGKVALRNYIQTIAKGQSIVRNQISNIEQQVRGTRNQEEKNNQLQDLMSYTQDHKYLTLPFGIAGPKQSKLLASSKMDMSRRSSMSASTVIFTKNPKKGRGKSTDLKFVFVFIILGILLQMVLMFHKHHFFNILTYLALFAIYFLNYFDHYYMKFSLALLGISILLDIAWLVVNGHSYWVAYQIHSTLQYGFLKAIVLFTIFLIFLKLIVIAIIFKYRQNPQNLRKQCTVFGITYPLDGLHDSPVAKIIKGDQDSQFSPPYY